MRLLLGRRSPDLRAALRAALVLGAVSVVALHSPRARAGQDCTTGPFMAGIDVSGGQGAITWSSVAGAGVKFAYMKASQGTYDHDSGFNANWSGSKAAGVIRGAYHFLDPTESGVTQANYFLSIMGTLEPGDLPPMLDAECPTSNNATDDCLGTGASGAASGAAITQVMNDWLTTVKAATGRTPVIYSYGSWFTDVNVVTTGMQAYPLWIADYSGTTCFNIPSPWTSAAMWQYGDTGTVAGISGQVDTDHFLGTAAQLAAFTSAGDGGAPVQPFAAPSQVNGNDALSLVNWADGHVEVYATKTGGTAARIDTSAGEASPADTWASPVALGGAASCGVASVYWAPGSGHTSEVFDGLSDGTTESLEYVASSSSWTSFGAFGGVGLSHLSTLAYGDSHIEVFALGDDGAIWHNVSTQSSWGGWQSMGAIAGSFATGAGPILWSDGHAEVFATDAAGGAWHNATGTTSPPAWSGWKAMSGGPLASRPIPARWADGHVEVFARGTDNHLYVSAYASGAFPAFSAVNAAQAITIAGDPSVLVYSAYGPEVFARESTSGHVVHLWNSSGTWSAWADDFGQVTASDPMAWMRPDGVAEVFGVDASGNVVKSLHSGASWSAWATIGAGFDACVGGTKLVDAGVPVAGADGGGPVVGADGGGQADAGFPVIVNGDAGSRRLDGGPVAASDAGAKAAMDGGPAQSDGSIPGQASPGGCSCVAAGRGSGAGRSALVALLAVGVILTGRRRRGAAE